MKESVYGVEQLHEVWDFISENKWLETTVVFKIWKQLEVGAEIPGFIFSL